MDAMEEYHNNTCIRFVDHTTEPYYLAIFSGAGCSATIGFTLKYSPHVSLGDECMVKGIILHELLQSVGFYHEHQRPDRDDYIRVNWDNIDPEFSGQFHIVSDMKIIDEFDYESISIFGQRDFAVNPNVDTITPTQPGISIEPYRQKTRLSLSDVRRIKYLYE